MKKFLAAVLAVVLVIAGLYPVQFVGAATTTQDSGLTFSDGNPWLYSTKNGYYKAESVHQSIPHGFEATVRLKNPDFGGDDRVIISNGDKENRIAGTFEFGITKETFRPKLAYVNANKEYVAYVIAPSDGTSSLATGEWLHLAVISDAQAGTISAYVNGELYGSVEGFIPDMTVTEEVPAICIGGDYSWTNTSNFTSDIKNVAFYTTLTPSVVATHASKGGVVEAGEAGLMSAYQLGLEENGTYPKKLVDINGAIDCVSVTAKFITEEEATALSKRPTNYDFSMVVIGDQQVPTAYAAQDAVRVAKGGRNYYPDDYKVSKVFQWVVDNVKSKNIQFAFNMGDIVDNYSANSAEQNAQEWVEGAAALKLLNGKIPYSIVRGNHDGDVEFNANFPLSESKQNVGTSLVSFDGTTMNNTYQKFQANGIKYMVVNLDFGIAAANTNGNEILAWANQVVENNPDYNVIVSTHGYLGADGVRLNTETHGNGGMTNDYYKRAKSGEDIWNEFVKLHKNIVMVLSGHVGSDGIIKTEDTGINGNKVVQLCVNSQVLDVEMNEVGSQLSGNVAMLYFSEGGTKVSVENYSTLRDQYYSEANQFTMTLERIGEGETYNLDNGAIAVPYSMVDRTGEVPTIDATFGDYLFAGWYASAGCTSDVAIRDASDLPTDCYAKFIPRDILSVKAQVSTEKIASGEHTGNWGMRFISSVESLDYKSVGFEILYDDNGVEREKGSSSTDTVYEKIKSSEDENTYNFSPRVITLNSQYFVTAKLAVPQGDVAEDYIVRAYIETFDGTKVYGPSRTLCVNDGLNSTTVNLVVEASEPLSGKGYTATFGLDGTGTSATAVELLASDETGYSTFRLTLPEETSLPSASKFIVKDGDGNTVATEIYRNYYTTHDNGTTTAQGDKTWYNIDKNADIFIVASSADVYGMNELIGEGVYFKDKTILLIKDVVLNKGTAVRGTSTTTPKWESDSTIFNWVAKGGDWGNGNAFNGTFDGDGNVISGLYINENSGAAGFFGSVDNCAVIRNLAIVNSYIEGTGAYRGTFVGFSYATHLENLYTDAVILHNGSGTIRLGGIVGHVDYKVAGQHHKVANCWFDGQIYTKGSSQDTYAGIVGMLYDSHVSSFEISDCLFSGEILNASKYKYPNAAGIIGQLSSSKGSDVTIDNCLNTGAMTLHDDRRGTGGIGGPMGGMTAMSSVTNCYAISSAAYSYEFHDGGKAQIDNYYVVEKSSLLLATEEALHTKLPVLAGQSESAWICYVDEDGNALGTPLLKTFASLWIEKQAAN